MALTPPPSLLKAHPKAKPVIMFPNQGKGAGFDIASEGEGNTLPKGYNRTTNMTCIGGRILMPSFAASTIQSIAGPVTPVVIQPWVDSTGLPFNIILDGNDAILHQNNSFTVEADATPRVAITAVADSTGIPSYTHASTASIQTNDVVNIDSSSAPSRAVSAVSSGTGGNARFTTTVMYVAIGDHVDINVTGYVLTNQTITAVDASHLWFEIAVAYVATGTGTVTMTTKNYNGLNLVVTRVSDTVFTVASQTFYGTATGNVQRENKYASMAMFDDGAGNEYAFAGTKTGRKLLQRRTRAGVWSECTNNANQVGIYIVAGGGRLYKTINDYQFNSFAVGQDPNSATPSAAIWVGTNTAKIVNIGIIEDRPLFFKEDGIWAYNSSTTQCSRIWDTRQDPRNFPCVASDDAGGLRTATADGLMVHIERFGTITTHIPCQGAPGRDTPRGRITGIACQGDKVAVLLAPYAKITQPSGLVVLGTTDGGTTYTDYTDSMTDQRYDQLMDITGLPTFANGGYILIGADDRFLLADIVMTVGSTSNARLSALTLGVSSTGAVTVTGGIALNLRDGTDTTPATTSTTFGQSGQIAIKHTSNLDSWVQPGTLTAFPQYANKFWLALGVQ